MKKYLLIPFLILTMFELALAEPYKIGLVIPLSGPAAGIGDYMRKGAELALENLPEDLKGTVKLIYEDDQLQAAKSVAAFQKLKSQDKINAVITVSSGIGHALAPQAEKAGVVMLAVGASDKEISAKKKFVFTHWISPEAEVELLVKEVRKRGYKKLAVVVTEQQGAVAVETALMEILKREKIDSLISSVKRFNPEVSDFKSYLAKVKADKVDGIISILIHGNLAAFAKQVRDLKVGADFFGFELFEDMHEVKASDGALVGKWYVNSDDATEDYSKNYLKKYNEQVGITSANTFDAINLLASLSKSENGDNVKIAEKLRVLKDYEGAAGKYSATGDNRFDLPVALKIVTETGFSKLKQ